MVRSLPLEWGTQCDYGLASKKYFLGANTLAYVVPPSLTNQKCFIALTPADSVPTSPALKMSLGWEKNSIVNKLDNWCKVIWSKALCPDGVLLI